MTLFYRHVCLSLSVLLLASIVFSLPAFAVPHSSIIALYDVEDGSIFDDAVDALRVSSRDAGCEVARVGVITGAQGSMEIVQPNRLVQLTCEAPVLDHEDGRAVLNGLSNAALLIAAVEGRFLVGPLEETGTGFGQRDYILKLSRYSNSDPDARDKDLADLGTLVGVLDDRYTNEVIIEVHRAIGFETPDEAVLIYYADAESGARFRENNSSVLERIGLFNRDHLTAFVYYPVKLLR